MKIIFDLDGTLICSKKRLYNLFCYLVGDDRLSFSAYWDLKFAGQKNQSILAEIFFYTKDEVQDFVSKWMCLVETEEYLKLDKVIQGVPSFLSEIKKEHSLYLCTARQSVARVEEQLSYLSISDCFEQVFVTEQRFSKEELLRKSGLKFHKHDWIFGDTGHDVVTGKALGIRTCAVLSGFMNKASLEAYEPDLILPYIHNFKFYL